MAFGEACWAAIEGSGGAGPRRQWRKMSGVGVNVDAVRREGRLTHWNKLLDNQLLETKRGNKNTAGRDAMRLLRDEMR